MLIFFLLLAPLVSSTPSDPSQFNVQWTVPTKEPGHTLSWKPTRQGVIPLGNGKLTASIWPNTTHGSIGLYIGHQDAMDSLTALIKMGEVTFTMSPNPFATGSYFNQTLDLSTGTVYIYAGGTGMSSAALVTCWPDAHTDTLYVTITGPQPFSLTVQVDSVRAPSPRDVFVDPLPASQPLHRPSPQSPRDAMRHASGSQRPLRTLPTLPEVGTFLPGSIITYHRNNASDGLVVNDTLSSQGCESLVATTPDWWADRTSGMVVDSGGGGIPLLRTSPSTLNSTSPSTVFQVRVIALAVQTDTVEEYLGDLGALVASAPPTPPRAAHESWWASFWARSFILVNQTGVAGDARTVTAAATPPGSPSLWLRASSLSASPDNSPVSAWADLSPTHTVLTQGNVTQQPHYVANAFGPGQPGVVFTASQGQFLANATATHPSSSTMFIVLKDTGSNPGCCSGALHWGKSSNGISTTQGSGVSDDDEPSPASGPSIVTLLDYPGSQTTSYDNIRGKGALLSARYYPASGNTGNASLRVNGCQEASAASGQGAEGMGVMVGSRGNELGRYFEGAVGEVLVYPSALSDTEIEAVEMYLLTAWDGVVTKKPKCSGPPTPYGPAPSLSAIYTITRYLQAIQSRGTIFPIKFNGEAYVSTVNDHRGGPDERDWGSNNWFQNTRLPYGSMLLAGDADVFKVLMDYEMNQRVFLNQRSQLYWNHSGHWTPETATLFGAYDSPTNGGNGWPLWLNTNPYIKLDWGGDSGTGEMAIMALDYYLWVGDGQYLPLAYSIADFYMNHFHNRTEDGRVMVWPAQVLETFWCDFNTSTQTFENCCANDAPTVSAMHALFDKLLALPLSLSTPAQRSQWAAFSQILPILAVNATSNVILPAAVVSDGRHNSEGPEMYPIHPHRLFTKGRQVASNTSIELGVSTWLQSPWKGANNGWNYAINAAVLLGLAQQAAPMLLARANTPPAAGYRFPGFAPHEQDFDPSSDREFQWGWPPPAFCYVSHHPLCPFAPPPPLTPPPVFFSTRFRKYESGSARNVATKW